MIVKWNLEKNELLKKERDVSFEQVEVKIIEDDLLAFYKHPNVEKYPDQYIIVIEINNYAYVVPCVFDDKEDLFLKTIIPSRKVTKKYLGRGKS